MTPGAILTALAIGAWGPVSHMQFARFDSLAACEQARPGIEAAMREYGYSAIRTACNEVKERGV